MSAPWKCPQLQDSMLSPAQSEPGILPAGTCGRVDRAGRPGALSPVRRGLGRHRGYMNQALSDVTVLDLGQVIAMPFCTMLLADMGARVIKVESRERGRERVSLGIKRKRNGVEERVPAAQYRDRNKLAVTLELKTPQGIELFKELVRHCDVVTENFSVGTLARLGLGYEDLKRVKPDIVYASITALDNLGERYTVGGELLTRAGNVSFGGSSSGVYPTTVGHVAIAAGASDAVWRRFCEIIGRSDLTRDAGFATAAARRDRRDQVATIIQGWTSARSKAEVVSTLSTGGVPAAPVNNVAEMVADPQVKAREMFVELDHPTYGRVKTTGTPLKLSETPGRVKWLAPSPGEHNREVFVDLLGHSPSELAQWISEGVI